MSTSDDITYVRLLINDPNTERTADPKPLFTNEEIASLITRENGTKRAAAAALLIVAASEALRSKVIRTQDLTIDGAKLATELRAQAVQLRAEADVEDSSDEPWGFEVVGGTRQPPLLCGNAFWPELTERVVPDCGWGNW